MGPDVATGISSTVTKVATEAATPAAARVGVEVGVAAGAGPAVAEKAADVAASAQLAHEIGDLPGFPPTTTAEGTNALTFVAGESQDKGSTTEASTAPKDHVPGREGESPTTTQSEQLTPEQQRIQRLELQNQQLTEALKAQAEAMTKLQETLNKQSEQFTQLMEKIGHMGDAIGIQSKLMTEQNPENRKSLLKQLLLVLPLIMTQEALKAMGLQV